MLVWYYLSCCIYFYVKDKTDREKLNADIVCTHVLCAVSGISFLPLLLQLTTHLDLVGTRQTMKMRSVSRSAPSTSCCTRAMNICTFLFCYQSRPSYVHLRAFVDTAVGDLEDDRPSSTRSALAAGNACSSASSGVGEDTQRSVLLQQQQARRESNKKLQRKEQECAADTGSINPLTGSGLPGDSPESGSSRSTVAMSSTPLTQSPDTGLHLQTAVGALPSVSDQMPTISVG
eukprot:CAMPEP_0175115044 /NCGR_PEP_ID=MMETSP0086_2-20121207/17272_1 /TAXON_ID=136419 /ORGANISM="Unknown Unknown, Strain D1" /LENGTH=231 /DNA_ID=CAMNT_0016394919 /DNA_START=98 /DNA_END=793 /DNA_ORIENTATION=-